MLSSKLSHDYISDLEDTIGPQLAVRLFHFVYDVQLGTLICPKIIRTSWVKFLYLVIKTKHNDPIEWIKFVNVFQILDKERQEEKHLEAKV